MMKKIIMILAALMFASPALANSSPRILYMAVDQGPNLLDINDPAFRRVFEHTGNYLHHQKFRLFEENRDNEQGMSFKEAMDVIAQSPRHKVDFAVLVSLRHIQEQDGRRLRDRMVGIAKIVDVRTLDVVDTLRIKSPVAKLQERRCGPACFDLVMRRHVREILPHFKDQLVDRLAQMKPKYEEKVVSSNKLTLTLKGFKPREIRHIEDRLVRLDNTKDLSALTSQPDKPAFWLERRESAGDVRDDLSQVLAELDLKARIIQTPRQVILEKIAQDLAYLD
ncbi:MAG: hypothetical protein ACNI26_04465 [Terasakiella sp.]|uniref:hypothetical protein n=1 Tax=unclassified Terasakiella TaxID=2614952 RepID=UPI003B003823